MLEFGDLILGHMQVLLDRDAQLCLLDGPFMELESTYQWNKCIP